MKGQATILGLGLLACGPHKEPIPVVSPSASASILAQAAASVEATPTPPPENLALPSRLVGTWTGPACEGRSYPRNLTVYDNGRFVAEDLVSPCPPGVRCVWSGIIRRTGTWSYDSLTALLILHDDTPSGGPTSPPLPPVILAPEGQEALFEPDGVGAPGTCAYHLSIRPKGSP